MPVLSENSGTAYRTDGVRYSVGSNRFIVPPPAGPAPITYWNGVDDTIIELMGTQWGVTVSSIAVGTFDTGRAIPQSYPGSYSVAGWMPGTQALAHGMGWFISTPTTGGYYIAGAAIAVANGLGQSQGTIASEWLGEFMISAVEHDLWRIYVAVEYDINDRYLKSFEFSTNTGWEAPMYFWSGDPR